MLFSRTVSRWHWLDYGLDARLQPVAGQPAGLAEEPQQLQGSHFRIEGTVLRQVTDPGGRFDAVAGDIPSRNAGDARGGREIAGQNPQRGRFAGSVGTQEGGDLSAGNREGDVPAARQRSQRSCSTPGPRSWVRSRFLSSRRHRIPVQGGGSGSRLRPGSPRSGRRLRICRRAMRARPGWSRAPWRGLCAG